MSQFGGILRSSPGESSNTVETSISGISFEYLLGIEYHYYWVGGYTISHVTCDRALPVILIHAGLLRKLKQRQHPSPGDIIQSYSDNVTNIENEDTQVSPRCYGSKHPGLSESNLTETRECGLSGRGGGGMTPYLRRDWFIGHKLIFYPELRPHKLIELNPRELCLWHTFCQTKPS